MICNKVALKACLSTVFAKRLYQLSSLKVKNLIFMREMLNIRHYVLAQYTSFILVMHVLTSSSITSAVRWFAVEYVLTSSFINLHELCCFPMNLHLTPRYATG